MKKLVFSLLAMSSIAFGQIEKKVGDFTKVTSFDRIDVMLIPSNENIVQLNGKEVDDVELINKKGELKIRMPLTKMLSGDNILVIVYFKDLQAVEANEGSRIACGDKIKATSFDIIAKEGSEVKLILDVNKLNVRVANGSKVTLNGKAINQKIKINTGGIYEAKSFVTSETIISVKAGGEANVYATELLDADCTVGGHITVFGEPKSINQDYFAGGTICFAVKSKQ